MAEEQHSRLICFGHTVRICLSYSACFGKKLNCFNANQMTQTFLFLNEKMSNQCTTSFEFRRLILVRLTLCNIFPLSFFVPHLIHLAWMPFRPSFSVFPVFLCVSFLPVSVSAFVRSLFCIFSCSVLCNVVFPPFRLSVFLSYVVRSFFTFLYLFIPSFSFSFFSPSHICKETFFSVFPCLCIRRSPLSVSLFWSSKDRLAFIFFIFVFKLYLQWKLTQEQKCFLILKYKKTFLFVQLPPAYNI